MRVTPDSVIICMYMCISDQEVMEVWSQYSRRLVEIKISHNNFASSSGLRNMYHLTRANRKLSIFLEAHDGLTMTANYSSFSVQGADQDYRLKVSVLI